MIGEIILHVKSVVRIAFIYGVEQAFLLDLDSYVLCLILLEVLDGNFFLSCTFCY